MSDELQDELEAINSIYGEGTLTPSDDATESTATYILVLPGGASSLKLRFPDTYPSQAPDVLGTHHSSGGKRGAGARDLGLFKDALRGVFQPDAVCLFDAMEDFARRYEEEVVAGEEGNGEENMGDVDNHNNNDNDEEEGSKSTKQQQHHLNQDISSLPPPPWILSLPIIDQKSTFLAHTARVTCPSQARLYVSQLLSSDRRFRSATHNMTAWRIRGENGASYQDCDDDGETAAGGRLLHLMQLMDLWDVMVVVSRWYGGVKLGPRRFAVINAAARDAFVRAGMVSEEKKEKERKKR